MPRVLRISLLCSLSSLTLLLSTSSLCVGAPQSTPPVQSQANTTPAAPSASQPATAPVLPKGSIVAPLDPLDQAKALYQKGNFDGAIQKYQQILQDQPKSPEAYAGLTRVYLKRKDVQQASDTINKALQVADSPALHVALGEVYFRQGKIPEAESEWVNVVNSGHPDARAYLGLARVRWAISMYKTSRTMIDKAHELDPTDPEIRRLWVEKLSRAERMKYLEEYLAGENNDDEETRAAMAHYLEYLKARAKDSRAGCHLVSKTTSTDTALVRLLIDAHRMRGYGLTVGVNGENSRLLLDTGASGIMINRKLAEKAGVTRLSDTEYGGIGDKGNKSGYVGLANSLKIGELEFQNCPVHVLEQRSVVGEDGLIGSDVFSSFLVDIDFPAEKLHLTELPKRPDDTTSTIALQTDKDQAESKEEEPADKEPPATSAKARPAPKGPQDRYIGPEMKSYTKIFRFGHALLVPTYVGEDNVPAKLFMLDTGAFANQITPAAASEVTKVHGDSRMTIKGIGGSVNKVFRADRARLRFGHLQQENQDLLAFDLTHTSDRIGTEVSGLLGFTMLRLLDVKIDYRDGLVDFVYDPKRFNH